MDRMYGAPHSVTALLTPSRFPFLIFNVPSSPPDGPRPPPHGARPSSLRPRPLRTSPSLRTAGLLLSAAGRRQITLRYWCWSWHGSREKDRPDGVTSGGRSEPGRSFIDTDTGTGTHTDSGTDIDAGNSADTQC